MKPLLLLDVDGVLAPFGATPTEGYPGYIYNEDYRIHVSDANKERLATLTKHFDIHWCTAWGEDANDVISPLHDLPTYPVVSLGSVATDIGGFVQFHSTDTHWKASAIAAYVEDRPYAFVDDDIDDRGVQYAMERDKKVPTLWLPVRCQIGLTDYHVGRLVKFSSRVLAPR